MNRKKYFADIKWLKLKISFVLAALFIQVVSLPQVLRSLDFLKDHETVAFVFKQALVGAWLWAIFGVFLLLVLVFFDLAMGNIRNSAFNSLLLIGTLGISYAMTLFFYWVGK